MASCILDEGCSEIERDNFSVWATRIGFDFMQIHVGKVLNHSLIYCCSICTETISEYVEGRRCSLFPFKIRRFILAKVFVRYVKEINFFSWLISNIIFPEILLYLCVIPQWLFLDEFQTCFAYNFLDWSRRNSSLGCWFLRTSASTRCFCFLSFLLFTFWNFLFSLVFTSQVFLSNLFRMVF